MQKLRKILKENNKSIAIGFLSAISIILIILPFIYGVSFENNIEYKDIFTLLLNILFIFFISRTLSKNYDSERKKKDILIDEIKLSYTIVKEKFAQIKISNYSHALSNVLITNMRDDIELLRQIITDYYSDLDVNQNLQNIQGKLRSIDRIIIPSSAYQDNLNIEHIQLIDENIRVITKEYFGIINAINNI